MSTEVVGSDFDKLLGELDVLAKAQSTEGTGAAAEANADNKGAVVADDKGAVVEDVAKSMTLKTASGEEIVVQDATELLKAFGDRLTNTEKKVVEVLVKAVERIKDQDKLIKSLQDSFTKLGDQGRGRRTTVTVLSKAATTESAKDKEDEGMKPAEFLAKADAAMKSGAIQGRDLAHAETCLNRGVLVPQDIVQRVMAHGK